MPKSLVEMPRISNTGWVVLVESMRRPGVYFCRSPTFCDPVSLMKSLLKALIEIGTSCSFCSRSCAVTTISSIPAWLGGGAVCGLAWPAVSSAATEVVARSTR